MTRIANVAKAGYFPTDLPVTELLSTWIEAPNGGRLLDPCAGTGEALIPLAVKHNLIPFGIELEEKRARDLKRNVTEIIQSRPDADSIGPRFVISGSFYSLETRQSRESFNIAYVNPPYLNTEDGRAEYAWLRDTRPLIMPGGLLIWVVPRHILYSEKTAPYLCSWFDDIQIRQFPEPFYDRFKQVIVFGIRRQKSIKPNRKDVLAIKALGQPIQANDIQPLDVCPEPYVLPALTEKAKSSAFRSVHIDPTDVVAEHHEIGIFAKSDIQNVFNPPEKIVRQLRPLMPMKIGHLIGVIAAGFLNNHILDKGEERLLIKGHAHKKKAHMETTVKAPKGSEHDHTVTFTDTDTVTTSITTMNRAGEFKIFENADMQEFLEEWLPSITTAITEQYPPLYNFDFNGYEAAINKLNLGRMIPIVNRPGLLPTQKHVVAAIATRLEHEKDALIDGEMGTGKTIMGAAIPAVMAAKGFPMKHILVLCPPHLVNKWQREIKHVWPRADTMAIKSRADVDTFFNHPGPMVGVMKETVARAGSGWLHSFNYLGSMVTKPRAARKKMHILQSGQFVNGTSNEVEEHLKPLLKELKEKRYVRCAVCGEAATDKEGIPLSPGAFSSAKRTCKHCNQPMFMDSRRRTDNQQLTKFKSFEWRGNNPMSQYSEAPNEGYAKYPLASYIKRKYKGKIDMFIADECHQYKAADSDRGYAYHRLAVSSKRTLNLTGTSYGGKASTLFSLLYRSSSDMRHAYDYRGDDGLKRWLDDYGIMQEIKEVEFDEHGLESGNSRSKTRVKELPGNSPAILPWLLNRSAFVSLNDLGLALPEYEEIPVGVLMEPEQAEKYEMFEKTLTAELRYRLQRKDKSLLGSYLQALLSLPDSPWRNKRVVDKRKLEATGDLQRATVASCKALPKDHLFPKEREIVSLIKDERKAGRRSLLLCQQTATLDITPQWVEMLEKEGIKAEVLKCEPTKREAWVKKAVERGVDVIITHPKRVETGLDLLDFPTIIWMGTEYSVYTILQASRRAWRIGQANKCKVYFFYYYETLQEKAMFLIASKVKAAIRMRGDTIADDSLADMDALAQDDMVSALTKIMMDGDTKESVTSLEDMFSSLNQELKAGDGVVGDFDMDAIRNDFGSAPEIVEEPITAVIEPSEMAQPQITFKKAAIVPTRNGVVAIPIKEESPDQPVILTGQTTIGEDGTTKQKRTHADGKRLVFGAPNGGMVDVDKVDEYIKPSTAKPANETEVVDWSHREPPKRPKVIIITHDSPAEHIEQFMPKTEPTREPCEEDVPADAIKIAMLCIFNLAVAPTAKEALDWISKDVHGRYDQVAKEVTDDVNTQVQGLALVLQQIQRDMQYAEDTGTERDHNGHSRYCRLLHHLGEPMPKKPSELKILEKLLGALSDKRTPHTVRKAMRESKDSLYFAVDQMLLNEGGLDIKDFDYSCTEVEDQMIRDEAYEKFHDIKLNPNTNNRLYRLLKDNGHNIPPFLHDCKPEYAPKKPKQQLIFGTSFMPEKPKAKKKKKEVVVVQQLAMF